MSVSVRVHTGIMSTDTRWLDSGWSQNQRASRQSRRNGPSESRLLHCSQMSVKEKQVENRAKKYSHDVLQRGHTKKETKKTSVAFVTKVQIKRKAHWAGAGLSGENVHGAGEDPTLRAGGELELLNFSSSSQDDSDCDVFNSSPIDTQDNEDFHGELFSLKDSAEDLQGMIRCLSRRLREPGAEMRRYQSVKPLASFARPTKGELSLSEKGPVILAPVLMSKQGRRSRGGIYDRDNGKDKTGIRSLNQQRASSSSARENILVRGRGSGGHRLSRSAPEGVVLGFVDAEKHLCSCCRGSLLAEDSGKAVKRSQSAATERERTFKETKRNSTGKLAKISRNLQQSFPSIPQAASISRPNISPCRGKGLLRHASLAIDLDSLNSRDYETPVPPSSPDQSDGEYCSDQL